MKTLRLIMDCWTEENISKKNSQENSTKDIFLFLCSCTAFNAGIKYMENVIHVIAWF